MVLLDEINEMVSVVLKFAGEGQIDHASKEPGDTCVERSLITDTKFSSVD